MSGKNTLSNEMQKLNAGLEQHKAGNLSAAESLYTEALAINPNSADSLYFLALIKIDLQKNTEARHYLEKLLTIAPNFTDAYSLLGDILFDIKDYKTAIEHYHTALRSDPDNPELLFNIGMCYFLEYPKGEKNPSKGYIERVVELCPDYAEAHARLAGIFIREGNIEKASSYNAKALDLDPNLAEGYFNSARISVEKNDIKTALQSYNKILTLDPGNKKAVYLVSEAHLTIGNFEEGWDGFQNIADYHSWFYLRDRSKLWQGEPLDGKRMYVYAGGGGFGDTIMCSRYIRNLKEMGATVICQTGEPLVRLIENSQLGADLVIANDSVHEDDFDYHSSFYCLLPHFRPSYQTDNYRDGYLLADHKKTQEYKEKYFNNPDLKVGVFWASSNRDWRSLNLQDFYPLCRLQGVKVYSLQKGDGIEDLDELPPDITVTDLGRTFEDFSDTAAAIKNLDLVISVDSSVIHLSGSLGKHALLLLPYRPDFKWQLTAKDSYWYSSVEIIRQQNSKSWQNCIDDVITRISLLIK